MMTKKSAAIALLVPTLLLLIPLAANFAIDGFKWGPGDFAFLWAVMVALGFSYKWVTDKAGSGSHRVATGIALAAGTMVLWGNLAVGFIGGEDNPANLMYAGVLALSAVGTMCVRFEPPKMARVMFATAAALALVPMITLLVRPEDFSPGVAQVFGLNGFFVLLFVVSGALFRCTGKNRKDERMSVAG